MHDGSGVAFDALSHSPEKYKALLSDRMFLFPLYTLISSTHLYLASLDGWDALGRTVLRKGTFTGCLLCQVLLQRHSRLQCQGPRFSSYRTGWEKYTGQPWNVLLEYWGADSYNTAKLSRLRYFIWDGRPRDQCRERRKDIAVKAQ